MCSAIRINSRIWNQTQFNSLSDRAKLAYFFITTHPHMTAIGALRGTLPGLAAELGWSPRVFRKACLELSQLGLVRHAEKSPLVWLPRFLMDNRPESPNVVTSWEGVLDELPDCPDRTELLQQVEALVLSLGEAFSQALPEAFRSIGPNRAPVQKEIPEEKVPQTEETVRPESPLAVPNRQPDAVVAEKLPLVNVPIPKRLQTKKFQATWSRWLIHSRDYGVGYTAEIAGNQLRVMSELGVDRSVEAIEMMIEERMAQINAQSKPEQRERVLCAGTS